LSAVALDSALAEETTRLAHALEDRLRFLTASEAWSMVVLDQDRDEFVANELSARQPEMKNQSLFGFQRPFLIEDEVTERVEDGPVAMPLDALYPVRM
jgi:hypothetical protein